MSRDGIIFSIVIPTYNRAEIISKTINTILSQTFSVFELIIIDDGSTDNTETVINQFSDKRILYKKTSNQERAAARNYGISIAKGDYITFVDSDDIFYSNHLSVAFDNLSKLNYPELFHIRYEITDTDGKVKMRFPYLNENANDNLIKGNFMSCNAVFIKHEVAKKNLFNTDRTLSGMEDWELWLRLAVKYKINYCNTITSAIINHNDRSVLVSDKNILISKVETLIKYILGNKEITNYYGRRMNLFKSSCYSYVALHLSLSQGNRIPALFYLWKGIKENPAMVFQRRFLAIIKHLI
jgi:glycosyltransferase involved in cell wall biosynthesis